MNLLDTDYNVPGTVAHHASELPYTGFPWVTLLIVVLIVLIVAWIIRRVF